MAERTPRATDQATESGLDVVSITNLYGQRLGVTPGPEFGEFQRGLEIRNGARGLSGASSAAGCLGSSGAALSPGERQAVGRLVTTVRTAVSLPVR
jgi:hypothetical protein